MLNLDFLTPLTRVVFIAALCAVSFSGSFAQSPGSLDPTFDLDGKLVSKFAGTDTAAAAVRQPDGKLIVVGTARERQPSISFFAMRMNRDGSLDTTFDTDGRALIAVGNVSRAYAVALQADGRIVVAGSTGSGFDENYAVARLNADGSLDTTFNTVGYRAIDLGYGDKAYSVLLQSDGKIVLVGTAETPERSSDYAVVRLNADGSFDTSFDTDGIVYTQVGPGNGSDFCYAGTLQPDGKIIAVGSNATGSNTSQTSLVRYNTDGSLDTSFDTDGKVNITSEEMLSSARSVVVQLDGKIVIGGTSTNPGGTGSAFTIFRLNADGTTDTSLDTDGKVRTVIGSGEATINTMIYYPDGKILAAGFSAPILNVGQRDVTVARYNPDGSLDTSFDTDGILVSPLAGEEDMATALTMEPHQGATVVGYQADSSARRYQVGVIALNANGSRDTTFSTDGSVAFWLGADDSAYESAYAVAPQRDGKILVGGNVAGDCGVARYNADGSFDTKFDGDGRLTISPLPNSNNEGECYVFDVAVQSDGKVIAVGSVYDFSTLSNELVVARFMPDGSPDVTFDSDGKVVTRLPGFSGDYGRSIALLSDGKILVGGEMSLSQNKTNFLLLRYKADGSLDTSFDTDGMAITPVGPARDAIYDIAVQADGKILATGYSFTGNFGFPQAAIVRYNADGSLDTTFDTDGMVVGPGPARPYSIAILPDSKILIGGDNGNFAAARFNPDGSIDQNFGQFGVAAVMIGSQSEGHSMVVQGDGKIVMVGSSRASQISELDFTLVRFNANGTLDTTFDVDGKVTTATSTLEDRAQAVAMQYDEKIVAVGYGYTDAYRNDFTIARYVSGYTPRATSPFDFDGDGKTDIGIFRPSVAEWWINRSSDGALLSTQFGATTDRIVPADYTGDGKTDIAFWRPASGEWFVLRSDDFSYYSFPFGADGDVPIAGDYDADGKADTAVFRLSNSTWYIRRSSDGQAIIRQFGAQGDLPVPADYDGDGKTDLAIFRPSVGQWWIDRSTAGVIATTFGDGSVKPVQGDYTGDGKADVAFWRPSTGEWFVLRSEDFSYYSAPFGTNGDIPSPGDYDGDGKFDTTVFRSTNATWYSNRSSAGTLIQQFGATGDRPVPNAFVP